MEEINPTTEVSDDAEDPLSEFEVTKDGKLREVEDEDAVEFEEDLTFDD